MNKVTIITALIAICVLYLAYTVGASTAEPKEIKVHDTIIKVQWEGGLDTVLQKDRRLWWIFVATKYNDLSPEGEHLDGILSEAMLTDSMGTVWNLTQRERRRYVDYAICVGKRETGNGDAGIGRKDSHNNHVGIKYSPTYFNWAEKKGSQNNAYFSWWGYSYYNLIERKLAGNSDWTNCWAQAAREGF